MPFIADLHIHSRFSRATSRSLDAPQLALWAAKKGISVVGTGDITHPAWLSELRECLVDAEEGLYRLRPDLERALLHDLPAACRRPTRFMLSGEISCIYKKDGKTRKLHHLVLLPDFEAAAALNKRLDRIGNITSDGRPILGLDSRDLLEIVLETNERAFFIPAHIWTPWFSLFGSKSGFDTLEDCFEDLSPHIHALETGLSSDPPMNRRLSALDKYILVSNSDAHSATKLGREANLFETDPAYEPMIRAMTDGTGFVGTLEFFPEEGKYHLDGHRKCKVRLEPWETRESEGLCPVCGAPVTVGVLNRVEELADREEPALQRPFHSLIPLTEVLSELLSCGSGTKKVAAAYEALLADLGPELDILMSIPPERIEVSGGPLLGRAVERMRANRVIRLGGYDGEYGIIRMFEPWEKDKLSGQGALFAPPLKKKPPQQTEPKAARKRSKPERPAAVERPSEVSPQPADPILDPLNPSQRQAVLHGGGHLLITAGPGTGKTLTLTHRIAHMIRQGECLPENVLALTFTNKAAGEMHGRISRLLGTAESQCPVQVSTFHRFGLDILREEGPRIGIPGDFRICSEMDAAEFARKAVKEAGAPRSALRHLTARMPRLKVSDIMGLQPEARNIEIQPCFHVYQRTLRTLGMLDLDDLETETLRLLRGHPDVCRTLGKRFGRVFVDEYQDTSPVQAAVLEVLVRVGGCEITAIGDPDQAIYGFRGAEMAHFHSFTKDFSGAEALSLTRNYRSTRTLLQGAAGVLQKDAPLEGGIGDGEPIRMSPCATHRQEAEMVVEQIEKLLGGTTSFSMNSGRVASYEGSGELGFGDMAVLFRLNAQAEAFEEAFTRAGIPYALSGEKPLIAREPVQLLWRYFLALGHPGNTFYREAYLHLLGDATRGEHNLQSCTTVDRLPDLVDNAAALHGLDGHGGDAPEPLRRLRALAAAFKGNLPSFLDALELNRGIDHETLTGDRVALMTFHAAKGLEWPVVFLTGLEHGILPFEMFGEADEKEELRLFYVALTRAGKQAFLSWAAHRSLGGRNLELPPSRFLQRLPEELHTPVDRSAWKPKRREEQLQLF